MLTFCSTKFDNFDIAHKACQISGWVSFLLNWWDLGLQCDLGFSYNILTHTVIKKPWELPYFFNIFIGNSSSKVFAVLVEMERKRIGIQQIWQDNVDI